MIVSEEVYGLRAKKRKQKSNLHLGQPRSFPFFFFFLSKVVPCERGHLVKTSLINRPIYKASQTFRKTNAAFCTGKKKLYRVQRVYR